MLKGGRTTDQLSLTNDLLWMCLIFIGLTAIMKLMEIRSKKK
jgi:hypothetical protein